MDNYYVMPWLRLAVLVKKFQNDKIQRGYVLNGNWNLVRGDEFWYALNVSDTDPSKGYVNRWEIDLLSDGYVKIPKEKQTDYNTAISYGVAVWELKQKLIPSGPYCYEGERLCPFWGRDHSKSEQESGFCTFLNIRDWEDAGGVPLLWDQIKTCNINDDWEA
jgi:hypothetical protein